MLFVHKQGQPFIRLLPHTLHHSFSFPLLSSHFGQIGHPKVHHPLLVRAQKAYYDHLVSFYFPLFGSPYASDISDTLQDNPPTLIPYFSISCTPVFPLSKRSFVSCMQHNCLSVNGSSRRLFVIPPITTPFFSRQQSARVTTLRGFTLNTPA